MVPMHEIPSRYSWWLHCLLSLGSCAAIVVAGAFNVSGMGPTEWLTVLGTVLFFIFFENAVHRFAMHRPSKIFRHLLLQHRWHHDAFSGGQTAIPDLRGLHFVLIPFTNIVPVVIACAVPASLVGATLGKNAFWAHLATVMLLIIAYETVHLCAHAPESWGLRRVPFLRVAIEHHAVHHHPDMWMKANFGMAFGEISDRILGTKVTARQYEESRCRT